MKIKLGLSKHLSSQTHWGVSIKTACVLLACIPLARIIWILQTNGANNLSNDYVLYVDLIDRILSGTYQWTNIFQDTYVRTHLALWVVLTHVMMAKFFHWNVYVEIYFVLFLTFVRFILLWLLLGSFLPNLWRWFLLPILSALVFSISQLSVFTFGTAGLALQWTMLGATLGIWGLARFPKSWKGLLIMTIGGILATWSWGAGLCVWPVFLLGMIGLGYRRLAHYLAWFFAALLACFPYLYFSFISTMPTEKVIMNSLPVLIRVFVDMLGRPFANNIGVDFDVIPSAQIAGWIGILIGLILGLIWITKMVRAGWGDQQKYFRPILLILFSILVVAQISLTRKSIAPWYTVPAVSYWVGLAGFSFALMGESYLNRGQPAPIFRNKFLDAGWVQGVLVLGFICGLYLYAGRTFKDKDYYLYSRSPFSAFCLRYYRSASTICEGSIFQWGVGHYQLVYALARPLERHNLSVFAPHQIRTMQGEFVADSIRTEERPGVLGITWTDGSQDSTFDFRDYRHLNLLLHSPNAIYWTVDIPANVEEVTLHSATAISSFAPQDSSSDGLTFKLDLSLADGKYQRVLRQQLLPDQKRWLPFEIDLAPYAGQTITLKLSSNMGKNSQGDWLLLRYPYIDLKLNNDELNQLQTSWLPVPQLTDKDVIIDTKSSDSWKADAAAPEDSQSGRWMIQKSASLEYTPPLSVCLPNFSHLYIRMAAPFDPEYRGRSQTRLLKIYYLLEDQDNFDESHTFILPLLPDGEFHDYFINLRVLGSNRQHVLTGLKLNPAISIPGQEKSKTQLDAIRFLYTPDGGQCYPAG